MNSLIRGWLRETATDPVPWELPIKEEWIYRDKNFGRLAQWLERLLHTQEVVAQS